jgi:hypothetical protein
LESLVVCRRLESCVKQPLVSRPAYGVDPKATAQLPSGGPSSKGLPLDDGLTGYKTFSKPEDDIRQPNHDDESIHRIDGPDDWAKDRDRVDVVDQSDASPGYFGLGKRDPNDYGKTKYPYRDGKPNSHNASDVEFLVQLHILSRKAALLLKHEEGMAVRVAATAEAILEGLNPKFRDRSRKVSVALKRVDLKKMRWIFSVKGNQVYAVKIRAIRPRKNVTKFSKMDLELSCSCPAWQWQGPEFHSTGEKYQLGPLMGTASTPDIRDPERQNFVCKHVAAVLETTKGWVVPASK